MNVTVEFPENQVPAWVEYVFADQLPFATSRALNDTAKDFQADQRERLHDIFEVRRKRWVERSIYIGPKDWARKTKLEARVSVDAPPVGPERDDIIGKFETDTRKAPFQGRTIAVPTEHTPRTGAGVIKKGWRPRELFANGRVHGFGQRMSVVQGERGTLLIRKPGARGTIFRRDGDELEPIYQLVPFVRIDPDLKFIETATKTVNRVFSDNMVRRFDQAIRTAR